jgi:hypothetical protein
VHPQPELRVAANLLLENAGAVLRDLENSLLAVDTRKIISVHRFVIKATVSTIIQWMSENGHENRSGLEAYQTGYRRR